MGREDEKQREEVVSRAKRTEMAEGLNSITKVRSSQLFKLLFSPFNSSPSLHPFSIRADVSFRNTSFPLPSLSTPWSYSPIPSSSRAFTETSRFFNMQHASHWDNTKRERERERETRLLVPWNQFLRDDEVEDGKWKEQRGEQEYFGAEMTAPCALG